MTAPNWRIDLKTKVLSVINTVTPIQSKTNIFHKFELDKDYEEMKIYFSYSPKIHADREKSLELINESMAYYAPAPYEKAYGRAEDYLPIVNLITISLEDCNGYRGCAHRHDEKQIHTLNETFASPGFYKGKISKGIWCVGVNLHCVITDNCSYEIEIFAEDTRE